MSVDSYYICNETWFTTQASSPTHSNATGDLRLQSSDETSADFLQILF